MKTFCYYAKWGSKHCFSSIFVYSIFLFLTCCASAPTFEYARASRAMQAAESEGAEYSPCGARDFYTAQRYLKMGQASISDSNYGQASNYLETARKSAENAEEKTLFCDKK